MFRNLVFYIIDKKIFTESTSCFCSCKSTRSNKNVNSKMTSFKRKCIINLIGFQPWTTLLCHYVSVSNKIKYLIEINNNFSFIRTDLGWQNPLFWRLAKIRGFQSFFDKWENHIRKEERSKKCKILSWNYVDIYLQQETHLQRANMYAVRG